MDKEITLDTKRLWISAGYTTQSLSLGIYVKKWGITINLLSFWLDIEYINKKTRVEIDKALKRYQLFLEKDQGTEEIYFHLGEYPG